MQAVMGVARRFVAGAIAGVLVVAFTHSSARANGAFPDSGQILLPTDRPNQIFVTSNFGLLRTDDAGMTWRWVCEQAVGRMPILYAVGPPPTDAIYTVPSEGLTVSFDAGGSWKRALGVTGPEKFKLGDAFPDRTDAKRVLSIGAFYPPNVTGIAGLYESLDGGLTFAGPKYQAPKDSFLNGVEIAKSDPNTIYLTEYQYEPSQRPSLVRSFDRGATFEVIDANTALSGRLMYILAIDPIDPRRVYFRVSGEAKDAFAYTEDGGTTITVSLELETTMSAFVRREDGRLLVGTKGQSFQSLDGGKTFIPWVNNLQFRGLGERDGVLYALGDNYKDGIAVGVSRDDGATWQKLLQFHEICGVVNSPDVLAICDAQPWIDLEILFGIPLDVCSPMQMEPPSGEVSGGGGCSCELGAASAQPATALSVIALIAYAFWRRARRTPSTTIRTTQDRSFDDA